MTQPPESCNACAEIKLMRLTLDTFIRQTDRRLSNVEHFAYGDGNGAPGARIRLDRIEQRHKRSNAAHAGNFAAVAGLWLQKIWTLLT